MQESLQAYLDNQLPHGKILSIKKYGGGYSNLTYHVQTEQGAFVLRHPPKGANIKSAHDMGREYRVIKTLAPYYSAIPKPIHYCADEKIIGSPFFLMEPVDGLILRGSNPPKESIDFGVASKAFIQNLAQIHQLELPTEDMEGLGKPSGYIERQVHGWIDRYYRAQTETIPDMDHLAKWLKENIQVDPQVAVIHNDYKYDNLVYDPADQSKIRAVLDWEMATVGSPLMDFGTTLAYWAEVNDSKLLYPFNVSWMPGNPSRAALADMYFEETGRPKQDLLFFYLFGLFKVGVIAQQIYARYKQGKSSDKRFEGLIYIVKTCGQQGVLSWKKGKISPHPTP